MRPLFRGLIDDFHGLMEGAFESGGRSIGRRWAPNTPGYARRKKGPVGVASRTLLESLTTTTSRYARTGIGRDSMTVATAAPHAHLFGAGRGGQKARPLLPTDRRLVDRWTPAMHQWLVGDGGSRTILPQ